MSRVSYSLGLYTQHGTCYDSGLFLHLDDRVTIRVAHVNELNELIQNLQDIRDELSEEG
jgi:hypothetical protein